MDYEIRSKLVIEVTKRKNPRMARSSSLLWRSLRPMNILMFTNDSSFEVSFLKQAQRNVTCVSWCSTLLLHETSLWISCLLASLCTLLYQTRPMLRDFIIRLTYNQCQIAICHFEEKGGRLAFTFLQI